MTVDGAVLLKAKIAIHAIFSRLPSQDEHSDSC